MALVYRNTRFGGNANLKCTFAESALDQKLLSSFLSDIRRARAVKGVRVPT